MAITWTLKWLGLGLDLNQMTRPASGRNEQYIAAAQGEVVSQQLSRGARLRCESGMVWLTVNGDREDYLLRAGETFTAFKAGHVVIQGMKPRNSVHVRP